MLAWSTKRQLQYLSIIVGVVVIFFVIPFYVFIYEAPNCFDGRENGDEVGVDCGGSCRLLCPVDIIEPLMRWDPRIFRVSEDTYNVLAYIENPNITAEVQNAPYIFKIYDQEGSLITERRGTTFIPKGTTFAVFNGNFNLEKVPFRVTFEFEQPLTWTRTDIESPNIEIRNSTLLNEDTEPRVQAVVENHGLERLVNVEFTAIVFDGGGNAIGTSRTLLELINPGEMRDIVFTWPQSFETDSEVCSAPVDVILALDRSGSMQSLGTAPPQPLQDVKDAAVFFVNQLAESDQVGVVSFAGEASDPLDSRLAANHNMAINAIDAITISTQGTQFTNITDALQVAKRELEQSARRFDARSAIVLLTDGVANRPVEEGNPNYPEDSARIVARDLAAQGTSLFTIGLGSDLNISFLREIASSSQEFYLAPTAEELDSIYRSIATKICQKRPAVIEIIPRVYPI